MWMLCRTYKLLSLGLLSLSLSTILFVNLQGHQTTGRFWCVQVKTALSSIIRDVAQNYSIPQPTEVFSVAQFLSSTPEQEYTFDSAKNKSIPGSKEPSTVDKIIQSPKQPPDSSVKHTSTFIDDDGCKGFMVDPYDKSIANFFHPMPPIDCRKNPPSFLYATDDGKYLKVDIEKANRLNVSLNYCTYSSLKAKDDKHIGPYVWSKTFTKSISLPENVVHIKGECFYNETVIGRSYLSIIRKSPEVEKVLEDSYKKHVEKEHPKETLSILIMGIDATSRNNFARHMPKTKSFIVDKMGAVEMFKVNKVGENTFPNVLALLSGKGNNEFRKMYSGNEFFDKVDHLFFWDKARLAGYRTSVILDLRGASAFHWWARGWDKPKFYFYNRPVVLSSDVDDPKSYCIGDKDKATLLYDYWLQMTRAYNNSKTTPYFGFSHFASATHDDINMASSVDTIYLELFKKFVAQNSLNNTLVVLLGDHGMRYGDFRSTFKGMLDDNNPFMFFIFPPWFNRKYPKIIANFRKNQNRLMSNFDVHATLNDLLYFQGDDIANRKPGKIQRGMSLFQELPMNRTCSQAGIPVRYCNCRDFSFKEISSDLSVKLSEGFLKYLIKKTSNFRNLCAALTLNSTISVIGVNKESRSDKFYQVTISTSPGGAVFEAALKVSKKRGISGGVAVVGDVQRLNMYRGQADCIHGHDTLLMPFCYCKNLL